MAKFSGFTPLYVDNKGTMINLAQAEEITPCKSKGREKTHVDIRMVSGREHTVDCDLFMSQFADDMLSGKLEELFSELTKKMRKHDEAEDGPFEFPRRPQEAEATRL